MAKDKRDDPYLERAQRLGYANNCHLTIEDYPDKKERFLRARYIEFKKDHPEVMKDHSLPFCVFRSKVRLRTYFKFLILNKEIYGAISEIHRQSMLLSRS